MQLDTRKINDLIKNWKELNRHFSKKDIRLANKYMKILNITRYQRMQTKTTMRYCLTPVRMAAIRKSANNKCWRGYREKGTFLHYWWECKLVQSMNNSVEIPLKNWK